MDASRILLADGVYFCIFWLVNKYFPLKYSSGCFSGRSRIFLHFRKVEAVLLNFGLQIADIYASTESLKMCLFMYIKLNEVVYVR